MNILHAALEYKALVGGVGYVTQGLTQSLNRQGNSTSIVTPGYDVYFTKHYQQEDLEFVTKIKHVYKGKIVESQIHRVKHHVEGADPVFHYLISPTRGSIAEHILDIREDNNIYQSLPWSNSTDRMEYFNSALAGMLRLPSSIPTFDIFHAHAWHTGLASVLAKEFETLTKWKSLYNNNAQTLKKIPHIISTIHMLRSPDHAELRKPEAISSMLKSVGLPDNFANKFPKWKNYINNKFLKRVVLALLYADHITGVSQGLVKELTGDNPQGLDDLFKFFKAEKRITGILNGIQHSKYDATSAENLGEYALDPNNISASKQRIKELLAAKYPKLDPNKIWFCYIARFAKEKGVEWLKTAATAIAEEGGVFIVMGKHVVQKIDNGELKPMYRDLIDELREMPNVFVIDDQQLQDEIGHLVRASVDGISVFSDNEAFGLTIPEGFAHAAPVIGPNIQGVPDSIKDLRLTPNGNGFLYDDKRRSLSIPKAIKAAFTFLREQKAKGTLDSFLKKLLEYSKQFDWDKNSGPKYNELYNRTIASPLLTAEKIHPASSKLLLPQYAVQTAGISIKPDHIFCIGFNKSGTSALDAFFRANKVLALHHAINYRTLASIMFENYKSKKPLLTGIERFTVFSDIEDIYHVKGPLYAQQFYRELERQYPNSKFILNTRDKDAWLRSRQAHIDPSTNMRYVDVLCTRYKCTEEELIARWSAEWDQYHIEVLNYFKDKPNKLHVFDLDDPNAIKKLCESLPEFNLDPSKFTVVNKTQPHPNATKEISTQTFSP